MTKEKIKELSTKDLIKKTKTTKTSTYLLITILLLLLGFTIKNTIQDQEFDVMMIVPISLSLIVFTSLKHIKEMEKEIANRQK